MNDVIVKERPILFSGAMVRALLAGTKTQTRRIVKGDPAVIRDSPFVGSGYEDGHGYEVKCPYGQPGDRLWARESHAFLGERLLKSEGVAGYLYRADSNEFDGAGIKWKPSIHMPRAASRLLLEITAVRCERLQDISEADAVAEGIWRPSSGLVHVPGYSAVQHYKELWGEINGPDSWAANPWVWVVSFRIITPD